MKLKKKDQGFSTASLKRRKFFSHVGKKGKFFRRERNSRAGEFDKHQMEWDECILGRQPIAVSLKHRFQQFTSVRQRAASKGLSHMDEILDEVEVSRSFA